MSLQPWRWSWRWMPRPRGSSRGARARLAALRGKRVAGLEPAAYGGHKDVNEAWVAGTLAVSAWPAAAAEGSQRMEMPNSTVFTGVLEQSFM